jgi:lysophospholipase L1-like esterase
VRIRLLAPLLAATTLACAGASAARAPVAVAVMGSSTAVGAGASAGNGWVDRVRKAATAACPDVAVSNLAVSGSNTRQGRANLDAALALKPVLVLVQYPSNDAASLFPLEETLANLATIRDGIRASGAAAVILGPFPRGFTDPVRVALMTGLRDALPAIAAPHHIDLWTDLAATDNQVVATFASGDGVHLGDAGHALIADKVLASEEWQATCRP